MFCLIWVYLNEGPAPVLLGFYLLLLSYFLKLLRNNLKLLDDIIYLGLIAVKFNLLKK